MVLRPAVASHYVHLRVVALLSAVHSDQDVLEHAARIDVSLLDVGHESRSFGLCAHLIEAALLRSELAHKLTASTGL